MSLSFWVLGPTIPIDSYSNRRVELFDIVNLVDLVKIVSLRFQLLFKPFPNYAPGLIM